MRRDLVPGVTVGSLPLTGPTQQPSVGRLSVTQRQTESIRTAVVDIAPPSSGTAAATDRSGGSERALRHGVVATPYGSVGAVPADPNAGTFAACRTAPPPRMAPPGVGITANAVVTDPGGAPPSSRNDWTSGPPNHIAIAASAHGDTTALHTAADERLVEHPPHRLADNHTAVAVAGSATGVPTAVLRMDVGRSSSSLRCISAGAAIAGERTSEFRIPAERTGDPANPAAAPPKPGIALLPSPATTVGGGERFAVPSPHIPMLPGVVPESAVAASLRLHPDNRSDGWRRPAGDGSSRGGGTMSLSAGYGVPELAAAGLRATGSGPEATQNRSTTRPRSGWDRTAPLTQAREGMRDERYIGTVFPAY